MIPYWSVFPWNTLRGGHPSWWSCSGIQLHRALCSYRIRFHLLRHLKADMVCLPSLSAQWSSLAPPDEGSAKFYYTLNKPTCSPMRSRHYRVSGVMDTVKWLCYYYYHNPDLSSSFSYVSVYLWAYGRENVCFRFYMCKLLDITGKYFVALCDIGQTSLG